jgi:hypothetical protein
MMRFALLAALSALLAAPAGAQTPPPAHVYHHTAVQHQASPMRFTNPGSGSSGPHPMNGQGCIGPHVNAAQTAINPITGKPQAATIVSIPLSKGAGGVASSTNRAQQAQACAQSRSR